MTTPGGPRPTPTPDPLRAHVPPDLAAVTVEVEPGDDLGLIAQRWGIGVDELMAANGIKNLNATLYPGQSLLVPQRATLNGPASKIIPDSELVYGPTTVGFDVAQFVAERGGYLASYTEVAEGVKRSGAELVQLVAERYSVSPRLLLALLEYQSGWVTVRHPDPATMTYPLGRTEGGTEGLFRQFEWAASALNAGFYGWREGALNLVILGDGTRAALSPGLNAGSAALESFFAQVYERAGWEKAVGRTGFVATFTRAFGDPFTLAVEPLIPTGLTQPQFDLPWAPGETWYFSAGPHGGWGQNSAWAALDFLPPGRETGCYVSPFWARAVARGVIARVGFGIAVLDIDGDGHEQTGWSVLYLHVAEDGRAQVGAKLDAGDPIGHPSCEGGNATGAHLHIARRYNGVWISPKVVPFVLGPWQARLAPGGQPGAGRLYQTSVYKVSCDCRADGNAVPRAP